MSGIQEDQVQEWLKKLERESWQLELLVSAFTIFLLIGANSAYEDFLKSVPFKYDTSGPTLSIISVFLLIIRNSIFALTVALIIHLMLRGFWIGTIGLRSVQSSIDFEGLNYSDFFTEKLKKKVISLDKMVVMLDEVCSVIFAFSFLIISILIAFGMYLVVLGLLGFVFSAVLKVLSGITFTITLVVFITIVITYSIMGLVYMIDYFSLGFFKKVKWFSRVYYPFYWFFNIVSLSPLSRSIYYYLISKFSKSRIRIVYTVLGCMVLFAYIFEYDQNQYFPEDDYQFLTSANFYDDQRNDEEYVSQVSVPSQLIHTSYLPIFLRYNPRDNAIMKLHCPDFEPIKEDGLNSRMELFRSGGNFQIRRKDYSNEDFETLLNCHSAIYQISINDSIYSEITYQFYIHPAKNQNGLLTMISTKGLDIGKNVIDVKKVSIDSVGVPTVSDYVSVPFWFDPTS